MDQALNSLIIFFEGLKKVTVLGESGEAFENVVSNLLKNAGFDKKKFKVSNAYDPLNLNIPAEEKKNIKNLILNKEYINLIKNKTNEKLIYIYQPFGSQNFPDFLIFTDNWILPLEIKFSAKDSKSFDHDGTRPKWNSNIPKNNALYIYGAAKLGKVTFFKGSDFLGQESRSLLINYFKDIDKMNEELKDVLKERILSDNSNPFGLMPYIRKDYVYNNSFSTDKNSTLGLFEYSDLNKWEDNLINFLKDIAKSEDERK